MRRTVTKMGLAVLCAGALCTSGALSACGTYKPVEAAADQTAAGDSQDRADGGDGQAAADSGDGQAAADNGQADGNTQPTPGSSRNRCV